MWVWDGANDRKQRNSQIKGSLARSWNVSGAKDSEEEALFSFGAVKGTGGKKYFQIYKIPLM